MTHHANSSRHCPVSPRNSDELFAAVVLGHLNSDFDRYSLPLNGANSAGHPASPFPNNHHGITSMAA